MGDVSRSRGRGRGGGSKSAKAAEDGGAPPAPSVEDLEAPVPPPEGAPPPDAADAPESQTVLLPPAEGGANGVAPVAAPQASVPSAKDSDCGSQADIEVNATGKSEELAAVPNDKPTGGIVQFSTAIYFAKEGEDLKMTVDVMRLGADKDDCGFHFETKDSSAKAGERYEAVKGDRTIKGGESMSQIEVPIIVNPAWAGTLEFEIHLSEPKNCTLGKYLYKCRVKVIDSNAFPTDMYKEFCKGGSDEFKTKVPWHKLLKEYFIMNFQNPVVRRRGRMVLITDQFQNVYFIWRLLATKLIIDKVINLNCSDDSDNPIMNLLPCPTTKAERSFYLTLFMISIIVPFTLCHYIDYAQVFWKVGGTSRKIIQSNLLRKFLNYDESSRSQIKSADLTIAMTRDTQVLVHDGFVQFFKISEQIGKLSFIVLLQLILQTWNALIPVLMFPVILGIFLNLRSAKAMHCAATKDDKENEMISYVDQVVKCFRLIADYSKRPQTEDKYEKTIGGFNKAWIISDAVTMNNKYFSMWISTLLVGIWCLAGGMQVVENDGTSTVGDFITTLDIFKEVGQSYTVMYLMVVKIHSAIPSLHRIVRYMNLPIDVEKRMRLNRKRRKLGEEARQKAREDKAKGIASSSLTLGDGSKPVSEFAADLVPIKFDNVIYEYSSGVTDANAAGKEKKVGLHNISFEFPQGSFVAMVGKPAEGKSTVLKLLGGVLIPDDGLVLIPPHLRCLHISQEPLFFRDTLKYNMAYGTTPGDPDADDKRIIGIMQELLVPDKFHGFMDPEAKDKYEQKAEWGESLSLTQKVLLNLSRALVSNPEILVIHKPTLVFDDKFTQNTFRVLGDYVHKKGIMMDPKMIHMRRPRTCVITTGRPKGVACADFVFKVTKAGVEQIADPKNVTDEMLG